MAKFVADAVLDAALNYIKNTATRVAIDNAQPDTYAHAITDYMLAVKTITSVDFTGPADDTSGRKLTTVQESAISVTNSGTAIYVCLCDTSAGIIFTTSCTSQVLTAGNTVTIPAWKINIQDPT